MCEEYVRGGWACKIKFTAREKCLGPGGKESSWIGMA
jgi:hypothetical protein